LSEYQYYEFLALDAPLSIKAQAEVRALSTRARITATSFVNEYHWGDFRGRPDLMMERHYDAHLYMANWGTRRVMFRLPTRLLSLKLAEPFCVGDQVTAWTRGKYLILSLTSEDEGADFEHEPAGALSALVGVRAELAAGDHRALYLAWLAAFGTWERDEDAFDRDADDDVEPPVPAGLGTLTAPQHALADFLRLDDDLLAIAAQASPPLAYSADDSARLAAWVASLPAADKDRLLRRVITDNNAAAMRMDLLRLFRDQTNPAVDDDRPRRTVADLLDGVANRRSAASKFR
jgi:hypothetical protein